MKALRAQSSELQQRIMKLSGQMNDSERGRREEGEGRGREGERGRTVATVGFLKAQLERVRVEISQEEDTERNIAEKLQVRETTSPV